MACRGILRIGRLAVEAPEYPSGDDAPMLAGELRVGRDRSRGREGEIALERKPQRAAGGGELVEAHVAEFRLAEPEIAKTERQIDIRVELRELGDIATAADELDNGLAGDYLVLAVHAA